MSTACASCYFRLGWDVLVCMLPLPAMWVPVWATSNSRLLLNELTRTLIADGERPVVFYVFSGAAKVRMYGA